MQNLAQIVLAGLDIERSDYDEDTFGNWYIYLDTVCKVRLVWDGREHILSVEEETDDDLNESIGWKIIFVSHVSDQNEITATLEEILKTK